MVSTEKLEQQPPHLSLMVEPPPPILTPAMKTLKNASNGLEVDPATPRPLLSSPTSATATPTAASSFKRVSFPPASSHPATPSTPIFPDVVSDASVPTSSRRAPSSPAMSRRASSSRASQTHSPNHSQSRRTSRVLNAARHRLSQSVRADEDEEKAPIMIRDFAFPSADPRHIGLGPDVPPPCDPRRLARRLRPRSTSSNSSLDLAEDVGDRDGEAESAWGTGAFLGQLRLGGQAWTPSAADADGVGAADFARNFGDSSDDADEETEIRSGLYRAQYPFEAEDDAEMDLVEGQVVYVLGSAGSGGEEGGGGGWAVAVCREPVVVPSLPPPDHGEEEPVLALSRLVGGRTDAARLWEEWWAAAAGLPSTQATLMMQDRRALVPDSFLVLIRADGETEAEARERLERWVEWMGSEKEGEDGSDPEV